MNPLQPDKRTLEYISKVKENIGFIESTISYCGESLEFEPVEVLNLLWETKVGKVNGKWVAEYIHAHVDDYDVIDLYFNRKPDGYGITTAILINEIESWFIGNNWDVLNRGGEHWLDLEGNLFEKWRKFKEIKRVV